MRYKKIMVLTIILTCLLAVSAVSATENATEDIVSADDAGNQIINAEENPALEQQDNLVSVANTDNGTFAALQKRIDDADENTVVNLENDYFLENGYKLSGISISKPLTINGNGYAIDANSQARIFYITATVTLKNITFINASGVLTSGEIKEGGAIYNGGSDCVIESCTFLNCSVSRYGGAIYNAGSDCNISSCTFTDCSDSRLGGAIYNGGSDCVIESCTFTDCFCYSGTIYNHGADCNISSCTFTNCSGQAIYSDDSHSTISSCDFTNCSSDYFGGAIEIGGSYSKIVSCTFTDCSSSHGGAIASSGYGINIDSCNFTRCFASSDWGGAINNHGDDCKINSCIFKECYSNQYGGAICNRNPGYPYRMDSCTIISSIFIKCSAGYGGAVYDDYDVENDIRILSCTFRDCHSGGDGGAVYIHHEGNISSCTFTNCTGGLNRLGSAIYSYEGVEVKDSNFTDLAESDVGHIIIFKNCLFKDSQSTTPVAIEDNISDNDTNVTTGNTTDTNFTDANNTGENETGNTVEPKITVPSLDKPASDGLVTITLPGDATGNVTLIIDGKAYSSVPVENGQAKVVIPELADGNYQYTIAYSGDSKYSPITNEGSMKINKTNENPVDNKTNVTVFDPAIYASDLTVLYSDNVLFQVTVNGTDGKAAKNIPVIFKVNGVAFTTANTDGNGVAAFTVTQVAGKYTVIAEALGANASATLTVNHIVKLNKVSVKRSAKKLVLTASLKKIDGKYLTGKKIKFKFNGKKYAAKTNKKGVAKVTVKSSVLKKLKVGKKITYQATYGKDTVKKSVKVKK